MWRCDVVRVVPDVSEDCSAVVYDVQAVLQCVCVSPPSQRHSVASSASDLLTVSLSAVKLQSDLHSATNVITRCSSCQSVIGCFSQGFACVCRFPAGTELVQYSNKTHGNKITHLLRHNSILDIEARLRFFVLFLE